MKFDPIPTVADPVPLPNQIKPQHRLQLAPLGDDLVAAFFDAPDKEAVPTSQLAAWSGDEALCLPLFGSRLARQDGGTRYVFFLARSSRELRRNGLWIALEDRPIAEIDPTALQSPVVDSLALIAGLAPAGERRLLQALVTTGQSLFGGRAFAGIRDIVLQLLERLAPPALALRAWCPLGDRAAIASYTLPKESTAGEIGTMVAIGSGGAKLMAGVQADVETVRDARLLHLFLPEGLPPGTTLVALSETPLRLAGPAPSQRQRPLGPWLARRSPQIRRLTRHRLTALAATDGTAAALAAEVSCPETALPQVEPHLVSCTGAGIFYAIGLRDPRRLLGELVLKTEGEDILLPLGTPLHHPRLGPVEVGFVPTRGECAPGDEAKLFSLFRSGRMSRIGMVTLDPLPVAMPLLLADLPAEDVARPLAAALTDALAARPKVQGALIPVARPAAEPQVTLIVELGASLDYPYALAAALAGRDDVVLTLCHPDRRALAKLRGLGEELHAIYGIGADLFDIAEHDLLPSERLRAAIESAATDDVIVVSGDVLPGPGSWLERWLEQLKGPAPVLAGAAVVGHDLGAADHEARPDQIVSARAIGLNRAAREVQAAMPLRVSGRDADIAGLAARLREENGRLATPEPLLTMTAHAPLPDRPAALELAERLTLAPETPS